MSYRLYMRVLADCFTVQNRLSTHRKYGENLIYDLVYYKLTMTSLSKNYAFNSMIRTHRMYK